MRARTSATGAMGVTRMVMTLDEARTFARGGHVILPNCGGVTHGERARGWVWFNHAFRPSYMVFERGEWFGLTRPSDRRKMRRIVASMMWEPIHPKTPLELLAEAAE